MPAVRVGVGLVSAEASRGVAVRLQLVGLECVGWGSGAFQGSSSRRAIMLLGSLCAQHNFSLTTLLEEKTFLAHSFQIK